MPKSCEVSDHPFGCHRKHAVQRSLSVPFGSVESDHQRVGGDRGRAQIEKLGTTFRVPVSAPQL